jgi:membrane-associated PAP2 superfamily phosphatase
MIERPQRPARPRRVAGRSEALWLLAIAVVTGVVFASGALDIAVARGFYRPDATDHWPLARALPWRLLYRAATWITASLVIAGLAALAASLTPTARHWRRPAVLVLLSLAIGPGLLGNALFKDHWQHPRPRELVEFGGALRYVPAPLIGTEGGASFPCGHCTVGFLYASGWWIWRRRRPAWAAASLAAGLLLGALLGVGRLAAGAHFLSDIVWAGLLALGVLHLVYYHVLPVREDAAPAGAVGAPLRARARWRHATSFAALLGGAAVLLALFATPHGTQLSARVPLSTGSPRGLEVEADRANVAIVLVDSPASLLAIDGELHGFGLPGSRLAAHLEVVTQPLPVLRYRVEARGWLTDVDGVATLRVPASAFDRVSVAVHRGDVRVSDATAAQVVGAGLLQLQLHADHGHIERP